MIVCPFCGGESKIILTSKDRNQKTSNSLFKYALCNICGLRYIEDIPDDLSGIYRNEQYDIPFNKDGFQTRAETQQWKVDILKNFVNSGLVMEIGPATGEFAFMASRAGFTPELIEMDKNCCNFLEKSLGFNVINGSDPAGYLADKNKYNAICIWQAIEHIPEFWKLLDISSEHVEKDGVIIISTPNPESFQAKKLGRYWPHIDAPRHLYLIPQYWFHNYAEKNGLSIVLDTTRDVGSTGLNYYGWYLAVRNFAGKFLSDRYVQKIAALITNRFRAVEEIEGNGCSYTIVLKKQF